MNQKYSVLLMYPAYMADHVGETYLDHVETDMGVLAAVNLAKHRAARHAAEVIHVDDFTVLLVSEGHIEDINPVDETQRRR